MEEGTSNLIWQQDAIRDKENIGVSVGVKKKVSTGHGLLMPTSLSDMESLRKQIKVLQEQRAAAMMNEVVDLQRERDLAMGKIKNLKKTNEDLLLENAILKNTIGRGEQTDRIILLERSLLEEQLMTSDLKLKLKNAQKQNATLMLKVKKVEQERENEHITNFTSPQGTTLVPEGVQDLMQKERSHSTSDLLDESGDEEGNGTGPNGERKESGNVKKGGSPPTLYELQHISFKGSGSSERKQRPSPRQPKHLSPPSVSGSTSSPLMSASRGRAEGTSSPMTYSPMVMSRRYKLTAAVCKDTGTQTDRIGHLDNRDQLKESDLEIQSPVGMATSASEENAEKMTSVSEESADNVNKVSATEIADLKADLMKLQQEKQDLQERLSVANDERDKNLEKQKRMKKVYEALQTECSVLREGLSEFSRWVRQKIQLVEEDMDICKVIYSLHGSLSQEAVLLSNLQEKLGQAEGKIARLEAANKRLSEIITQTEDKYRQAKKKNGLLHEKLILLTPPKLAHTPGQKTKYPSPVLLAASQSHDRRHGNRTPVIITSSQTSSPKTLKYKISANDRCGTTDMDVV